MINSNFRQITVTREEEAELIIKAQCGDIEARNRLILAHYPLIINIAKKYASVLPVEDRVSHGVFGLIKAIDKFDPGRGVKLITYAYQCICSKITQAIAEFRLVRVPAATQQTKRKNIKRALQRRVFSFSLMDHDRPAKETSFYNDITVAQLLTKLDRVTLREAVIGRLQGKTYKQIAAELGVTKQAVQSRYRRAIKIMKEK